MGNNSSAQRQHLFRWGKTGKVLRTATAKWMNMILVCICRETSKQRYSILWLRFIRFQYRKWEIELEFKIKYAAVRLHYVHK